MFTRRRADGMDVELIRTRFSHSVALAWVLALCPAGASWRPKRLFVPPGHPAASSGGRAILDD